MCIHFRLMVIFKAMRPGISLLLMLLTITTVAYSQQQDEQEKTGRQLFIANCAMCHRFSMDIVGPKLEGVTNRRDEAWLRKMIVNGQALIKSGDSTANALYQRWGRVAHPNQEHLSEKQIDKIIAFMKEN